MDISIDKSDLLAVLSRAQRTVAKGKPLVPAAQFARLAAADGMLTVTATDLLTQLVTRCPAKVDRPGEVGVLPDRLISEVTNIADSQIRLTLDDAKLRVRGQSSKRAFTLATMHRDTLVEPKSFERGDEFEVSGELLAKVIGRVMHAVSTDETRAHLNCLCFDFQGDAPRLVATDGHRMSMMILPAEFRGSEERLLPLAAAKVIAAAAPTMGLVRVSMTDAGFSMFSERTDITTQTVNATFPPWRQVVPSESSLGIIVSLPAAAMAATLRAAGVAANPRTDGVKLHIAKDGVRVTSQSDEASFDDHVDAGVTGRVSAGRTLDTVTIGCSAKYLLDAITACESDEIQMHVGGELDPFLFVAEGFQAVVMPMRI